MNDPTEALIRQLDAFAKRHSVVRGLAIVGSQARKKDHPADDWSDLDVLVMAKNRLMLRDWRDWVGELGAPVMAYLDEPPVRHTGQTKLRLVFEGGIEADLVIVPASELGAAARFLWLSKLPGTQAMLAPVEHRLAALFDLVRRGMKILSDKDGVLGRLEHLRPGLRDRKLPSARAFDALVQRFWHGALWSAKHLARGELWRVKTIGEPARQQTLLKMIEWHARARRGVGLDTWDRGRFIDEWADERVVKALPHLFSPYDAAASLRSLNAAMALFGWLATETATSLEYAYPIEVEREALRWIQRCRGELKVIGERNDEGDAPALPGVRGFARRQPAG